MADKPKVKIGAHWKRPPTRVYDYNYDVGQNYYKPMMKHLDRKSAGISSDLPGPKTFAERLAEDPLHGISKPLNYGFPACVPTGAGLKLEDGDREFRRSGARDVLSDFPFEEQHGRGDTDAFDRQRPNRLNMPSVSDQILESAGLKTGDSLLNNSLVDARSKRRPVTTDPEDLINDPFLSKNLSIHGSMNTQDSSTRRRQMLQDMDNELKEIDSGLEKFGRGKGSLTDNLGLTSASSALASSTSSLNIKKRSLKTTVTTETVRY